jgi:hypothetical protein
MQVCSSWELDTEDGGLNFSCHSLEHRWFHLSVYLPSWADLPSREVPIRSFRIDEHGLAEVSLVLFIDTDGNVRIAHAKAPSQFRLQTKIPTATFNQWKQLDSK